MTQHLPRFSGHRPASRHILVVLPAILVPVLATVLVALAPNAPASTSRTGGGVARPAAARQTAARPAMTVLSTVVQMGSCRARGRYASCSASGSASHPVSMHVHVTARPAQRV